jgi:hypothetical protein
MQLNVCQSQCNFFGCKTIINGCKTIIKSHCLDVSDLLQRFNKEDQRASNQVRIGYGTGSQESCEVTASLILIGFRRFQQR